MNIKLMIEQFVKYEGEFMGFRRIAETWNQNWAWE